MKSRDKTFQLLVGSFFLLLGGGTGYIAGMGYPDTHNSLRRLFESSDQERKKKSNPANSGKMTLDARYDARSSIGKAAILIDKMSGHIKAEDFPVLFAEVMDESWLEFWRDDSKSRIRRMLLEEWTRIAPRQAMIEGEKYLGTNQFIKGEIYDAWSKSDPEGALEFYFNESNAFSQDRTGFLYSIISNWTAAVPDKSWAWLMSCTVTKEEYNSARRGFFSALAGMRPERVKDYIDKIPLDDHEKAWLTKAWYKVDLENASAWADAQSSDDLREEIDVMEFHARASQNLAETLQELDKLSPYERGRLFYTIPEEVLASGAENDRQLIEAWATYGMNGFDEGITDSYPTQMEGLVDKNLEDVKAWIKELPAGKMRDHIVDIYVRRDFYSDYEANMKLAESIEHISARKKCMSVLLERWEHEEPERAAAWREATGYGQSDDS